MDKTVSVLLKIIHSGVNINYYFNNIRLNTFIGNLIKHTNLDKLVQTDINNIISYTDKNYHNTILLLIKTHIMKYINKKNEFHLEFDTGSVYSRSTVTSIIYRSGKLAIKTDKVDITDIPCNKDIIILAIETFINQFTKK